MNTSFYGGRWGKNFEIAKIFTNKLELFNDLNDPNSSIHCGELVFISYGNNYDLNLDIDGGKSYNNTLWKKDYLLKDDQLINIEIIENETNPKLVYRQLANISGMPAKFKVGKVQTIQPNEQASVDIDSSDIQNPIISFMIPKGEQGIQGEQGYYFIPSVSATGEISWTNNGGLENPKTINITGPQGIQGEQGYYFIPFVNPEGIISWTNNGNLNNPIEVNIKGPQGDQGPVGYYFIPNISDNGDISWTNNGSLDNPPTINIKGPKGDDGTSFTIKGMYGTLEELKISHPTGNPGDAYAIGTSLDNEIYFWSVETSDWVSLGSIQGPQGIPGVIYTPSVTSEGQLSWTNNGSLENPQSVNIKGPKGDPGDTVEWGSF